MKHGNTMNLGGGAKIVSFTITTNASGDPVTPVFGPTIGGAVAVARTGTGVYTLTWDNPTYGANGLSFWDANVNLASGDWTIRGSVNRSTGVLTLTFLTAGVATNIVSGEIGAMLVFNPVGY